MSEERKLRVGLGFYRRAERAREGSRQTREYEERSALGKRVIVLTCCEGMASGDQTTLDVMDMTARRVTGIFQRLRDDARNSESRLEGASGVKDDIAQSSNL